MRRLITSADFVDLYFQAKWSRFGKILRMLHLSSSKRTLSRWNVPFDLPINWYDIPASWRRINRRVSGHEDVDYAQFVVDTWLRGRSRLKLISPGCGGGDKELRFARFRQFERVDGFDIAPTRIETARSAARDAELANTNFFVGDVGRLDTMEERYDVFLFDSSLHHFTNVRSLMRSARRRLKPDGLLVVLEYTGPRRYQYTAVNVARANEALALIPRRYRVYLNSTAVKRSVQAPGYLRMYLSDPSEGVEADEIIPSIAREFEPLKQVKIGGDLIALVLKGIAHHFVDGADSLRVLQELFAFEDAYLETVPIANYTFGVYRPKPEA